MAVESIYRISKMIRVLHYIPGFLFGGIESLFLSWFRHIDHDNIEFELLLRTQDDNCQALMEYRAMGGKYYRLPVLSIRGISSFKRGVSEFFAEHHDYDIVHVHVTDPFVMHYAKKNGIKKIVLHSHTTRSNPGFNAHVSRIYEYFAKYRYVDYAFACSKEAAKWKYGKGIFKGVPVVIIKNAIETERYLFDENKRRDIRSQLGLEDAYLVGFVGRLTPPKNPLFLIEIFSAVHKRNNSVRFMVVGDGPYRNEMEKRARDMGVFDNTIFLGDRNDIPDLMCAMDCIVMPSVWEGFGMVVIEAQASGLPCVISDAFPKDVDITELVRKRISNKAEYNTWVNAIISSLKSERNGMENTDFYTDRKKYCRMVDRKYGLEREVKHLVQEYERVLET